MRYATAAGFRTALEHRLLALSREQSIPLVRLRKLVVFDRLLARLLVVAGGRWVLKGGVALNLRVGPRFRTTKDLDLGRADDEQAATADLLAAQSTDLGDYFRFFVVRTTRLDDIAEGAAVRYHVTAEVAGRPFEEIIVDVGFGDSTVPDPELLRGPDLLAFADIPSVAVPALPLEQHVAEKVHAYSRTYSDGRSSSRVKDLVDLVTISSRFAFSAARLRRTLRDTFEARATHPLPAALAAPPADWAMPYRRMAADSDVEADIAAGHERAAALLDGLLAGEVPDAAAWEPLTGRWR